MKTKKYFYKKFSISLKDASLVITFFIFTTFLMKLSIIEKLDTLFSGDVLMYSYIIHFYKESLSKMQFPLSINKIYYPGGIGPLQAEFPIIYFLLAGLTALFTGLSEIVILNIFHIVSIFLSGISMYALLYFLTKNKYCSLMGGFIYLTSPYLLIPTGWVGLIQLFWIPLIFLYIEKIIINPNMKNSFLLGFFYSMQFFNSQEYTLYLTIIVPIYILSKNAKILKNKKILKSLIYSLLIFLILSGWYIKYFLHGEYEIRTLDTNREYSLFNYITFFHSPIILILSVIGCYLILRMKLKNLYSFLIIGILSLLFALGPFSAFAPYTFLYKLLPILNAFRTPYRMFVFTLLLVSISITVLLELFYKKARPFFYIFSILLIIFLFVSNPQRNDYFRFPSEEEKMYRNISLDPENFSITEYPNIQSNQYVYHILFHDKNLVGGSSSPPKTHIEFLNYCEVEILNVSNDSCIDKLKELNVKYVIYHSDKYINWYFILNEIKNSKYMSLIGIYDKAYLFKLVI